MKDKIKVTKDGRIYHKNLKRYLNPRSDGRGYLCVDIDGKTYKAHLVVALVVHGDKPTPKHLVMHRNNKKHDNRPCNVFYGLPSDNMKQAHKDGLMSHKKQPRPVIAKENRRKRRTLPNEFSSISQAARHFGISPGTIHSALTGKSKTAFGFEWAYV